MTAKRASAGRRRVQFSVHCAPGSSVFVAGSFNHWDAAAKPLKERHGDGVFTGTCMLTPGTYEYKYVINGEWTVDPGNPNFVVNALGTLNSVIQVS